MAAMSVYQTKEDDQNSFAKEHKHGDHVYVYLRESRTWVVFRPGQIQLEASLWLSLKHPNLIIL